MDLTQIRDAYIKDGLTDEYAVARTCQCAKGQALFFAKNEPYVP